MEFWLDTTDEATIVEAHHLNILTGVTTNPSILSKEPHPPEYVLKKLLDIQPGYVAVQVTAEGAAGMVKQAQKLAGLSRMNRMIIKIPASQDGFKAMALLKKEGIFTLATAVFEPKQLVLSAVMGADYIAPYFDHIHTTMGDAEAVLKDMQEIVCAQQFSTKIMAAAIHSTEQFCACARIGVPAITLPAHVYQEMFRASRVVDESLQKFKADWQANPATADAPLYSV